MSAALVVALAAVLAATTVRCRDTDATDSASGWLETVVIAATLWLLWVGIAATLLATARVLTATTLSITAGAMAVGIWPWRRARRPTPRVAGAATRSTRSTLAVLAVVLVGAALRLLPMDYALAGRDQGTYTLRAEHTARTGALDLRDGVLADASRQRKRRSGPGDILGLVPTSGDKWRKDRYEGAYRPGLYLADRHTGHVVPQFFHLHPLVLASAELAVGPAGPAALVFAEGVLALLAFAAVAMRLWPRGPWPVLAVALLSVAPLMIWVQRNALSEGPAMLLLWAAVLAALRARDGSRAHLVLAAMLLGGTAWVRGHGLLIAPCVAVVLWALPKQDRNSAATYGAVVLGSVFVHAGTVYPYIHDEIARMASGLHPSPAQLVGLCLCFALGWDGVHRLVLHRRPAGANEVGRPNALATGPRTAGLAVAVALGLWLVLRAGSEAKPFARLDPVIPLVGAVLGLAAVAGLVRVARTRLPTIAASVWLAAIAVALTVPILLYARRNLPQGGLYYYGRYLAPELWPVVAFAATEAMRGLALGAKRWRHLASAATALCLVAATAMPLWTAPTTRIREFDGARRMVETLAGAIPRGAVVIAGGEGWHHGHTFNQVGGALLLSHGITVLPYRSREAAYATLHELLVAAPRPDRPVFLLLNEATKPYRVRGDDGKPTGPKTAALDGLLDAPFVARDVSLLEMFVHRLTPVTNTTPARVTRDELRMALLRVTVDAELAQSVERIAPPGGTKPRCLRPNKTVSLALPPSGAAGQGPVSIVVVASPGTANSNEMWSLDADGAALAMHTVGKRHRPRDTLGPFVLDKRPTTLSVRGAKRRHRKAPCPHGGIEEIRIMPIPHRLDPDIEPHVHTIAPHRDLGHPIDPATWVAGRGLSKARPGIISEGGPLRAKGPSLVLRAGQRLTFPREPIPGAGTTPVTVIVTLAKSEAGPNATLDLLWDGHVAATITPPPARARSWQSEPLLVSPASAVARLGVVLTSDDPDARVLLRDIGLFVAPAEQPARENAHRK